jgi:hypothetical protein
MGRFGCGRSESDFTRLTTFYGEESIHTWSCEEEGNGMLTFFEQGEEGGGKSRGEKRDYRRACVWDGTGEQDETREREENVMLAIAAAVAACDSNSRRCQPNLYNYMFS